MKDGRKQEYPEKTPVDEFQNKQTVSQKIDAQTVSLAATLR